MLIGLPILPAHAGNLGSAYPYNLPALFTLYDTSFQVMSFLSVCSNSKQVSVK